MRVLSFKKEEKSQRIEFQQAGGGIFAKKRDFKNTKKHMQNIAEHTKKKIENTRETIQKKHIRARKTHKNGKTHQEERNT